MAAASSASPNEAYLASAMVDEFIARSNQQPSSSTESSTSVHVTSGTSHQGLHVPSPSSTYPAIDYSRERYPLCVVWTPLPLITWILPFIGHMGICDSRGIIHDFAGPYFVSRDNMAFGNPVKFWYLYPEHVATELVIGGGGGGNEIQQQQALAEAVRRYDKGIAQTTDHFKKTQFYNFFCNNCHSFVAHCIIAGEQLTKDAIGDQKDGHNKKIFKNKTWNMVTLTMYLFFFGRYVSWGRFLIAHIPFLIFMALIVGISWGASAVTKKM